MPLRFSCLDNLHSVKFAANRLPKPVAQSLLEALANTVKYSS